MAVQRDVGLQFALMTEILDPKAQKRQVEEKIKAVEEWNNLFLRERGTNGYPPLYAERTADGR